jgi:hypothetical protein
MSWLSVKYHPGFAEDLTHWKATVSSDGQIIQTVSTPVKHSRAELERIASLVRARRESEIKPSECFSDQEYSSQVSQCEMEKLQSAVEQVPLEVVARAFSKFTLCDAPTLAITVSSGQGVRNCSGPPHALSLLPRHLDRGLLSADEYKECKAALESFLELWRQIEKLMPWQRD